MKSCSQCHSLIPDDAGFCSEYVAKQLSQQALGTQQGHPFEVRFMATNIEIFGVRVSSFL